MKIESDLEFYCYLKKNLPKRYQIISEPSTSYYSEWHFNYTILLEGKVYKKYTGDFRKLIKGKLIQEARSILIKVHKNKLYDNW